MRKLTLMFCGAALVAACGGAADSEMPADSMTAAGTMAATISLGDVAGSWDVRVLPEVGDSLLTTFKLAATGTEAGWTMTFEGRDPIPLHVMPPAGDSIILHAGPYMSALRDSVMVTTENVVRIVDGKLMGHFRARYQTTGPDSITVGRTEGTRGM